MFESILGNTASSLGFSQAALCTGVSLLCGLFVAIFYMITVRERLSKAFVCSLVIIPALVQTVIMLVNGNLGTGVAIVGAFSLIRFRSIPGNSRDISAVFFAMVIGLATGMGYLSYAGFITVFIGVAMLLIHFIPFLAKEDCKQELKITIYENLDYTTVFDEVFEKYLKSYQIVSVKTTNMGSMYLITYEIMQKDLSKEKEFLDELRCRNGNLNIICSRVITPIEQL